MPFPLAHPAAVLPLRRYCPRFLDFPALVIGSLVPDLSYALARYGIDDSAHEWLGGLVFGLPVGLILTWLFYGIRSPVVALLPPPHKDLLLPLCQRRAGSWLAVAGSLFIGVTLHILWDAGTHKDGWLAMRVPLLQTPFIPYGHRIMRVSHLVWYFCTFAGAVWVAWAGQRWLQAVTRSTKLAPAQSRLGNALLFGALVLVLAVAHHVLRGWVGNGLVAAASAGLAIGFAWWLGRQAVKGRPAASG